MLSKNLMGCAHADLQSMSVPAQKILAAATAVAEGIHEDGTVNLNPRRIVSHPTLIKDILLGSIVSPLQIGANIVNAVTRFQSRTAPIHIVDQSGRIDVLREFFKKNVMVFAPSELSSGQQRINDMGRTSIQDETTYKILSAVEKARVELEQEQNSMPRKERTYMHLSMLDRLHLAILKKSLGGEEEGTMLEDLIQLLTSVQVQNTMAEIFQLCTQQSGQTDSLKEMKLKTLTKLIANLEKYATADSVLSSPERMQSLLVACAAIFNQEAPIFSAIKLLLVTLTGIQLSKLPTNDPRCISTVELCFGITAMCEEYECIHLFSKSLEGLEPVRLKLGKESTNGMGQEADLFNPGFIDAAKQMVQQGSALAMQWAWPSFVIGYFVKTGLLFSHLPALSRSVEKRVANAMSDLMISMNGAELMGPSAHDTAQIAIANAVSGRLTIQEAIQRVNNAAKISRDIYNIPSHEPDQMYGIAVASGISFLGFLSIARSIVGKARGGNTALKPAEELIKELESIAAFCNRLIPELERARNQASSDAEIDAIQIDIENTTQFATEAKACVDAIRDIPAVDWVLTMPRALKFFTSFVPYGVRIGINLIFCMSDLIPDSTPGGRMLRGCLMRIVLPTTTATVVVHEVLQESNKLDALSCSETESRELVNDNSRKSLAPSHLFTLPPKVESVAQPGTSALTMESARDEHIWQSMHPTSQRAQRTQRETAECTPGTLSFDEMEGSKENERRLDKETEARCARIMDDQSDDFILLMLQNLLETLKTRETSAQMDARHSDGQTISERMRDEKLLKQAKKFYTTSAFEGRKASLKSGITFRGAVTGLAYILGSIFIFQSFGMAAYLSSGVAIDGAPGNGTINATRLIDATPFAGDRMDMFFNDLKNLFDPMASMEFQELEFGMAFQISRALALTAGAFFRPIGGCLTAAAYFFRERKVRAISSKVPTTTATLQGASLARIMGAAVTMLLALSAGPAAMVIISFADILVTFLPDMLAAEMFALAIKQANVATSALINSTHQGLVYNALNVMFINIANRVASKDLDLSNKLKAHLTLNSVPSAEKCLLSARIFSAFMMPIVKVLSEELTDCSPETKPMSSQCFSDKASEVVTSALDVLKKALKAGLLEDQDGLVSGLLRFCATDDGRDKIVETVSETLSGLQKLFIEKANTKAIKQAECTTMQPTLRHVRTDMQPLLQRVDSNANPKGEEAMELQELTPSVCIDMHSCSSQGAIHSVSM